MVTTRLETVDGVLLNVAGDLEPDGRGTVILLHGFTENATTWKEVAPRLSERYRVIRVTLIGHAPSDAPRDPELYTMDAVVRQLARVADLLGTGPCTWVGYSMGARVALHVALQRPDLVTALVLAGASPGLGDASARRARRSEDAARARVLREEGLHAFLDDWLAHPVFAHERDTVPRWEKDARAARAGHDPVGLALSLEGMGQGAQEDLTSRLHEVACPVLLVTGAEDEKFTRLAARMRSRFPRARHLTFHGCGHAPHREDPDAFADAVAGFLDSHGQSVFHDDSTRRRDPGLRGRVEGSEEVRGDHVPQGRAHGAHRVQPPRGAERVHAAHRG